MFLLCWDYNALGSQSVLKLEPIKLCLNAKRVNKVITLGLLNKTGIFKKGAMFCTFFIGGIVLRYNTLTMT